jgi:hypothetical protein
MNQISNQKTRPCIARPWVGGKKHIIWKDCDVPLDPEFAKEHVADTRKVLESPFQHPSASDFAVVVIESLDPYGAGVALILTRDAKG